MKRRDFDALVSRVEARYAARPRALERSAMRWVVLGRAAVVTWLGLLFLLGAITFAGGTMLGGPGVILLGLGVALLVFGIIQASLFLFVDTAGAGGSILESPLPEGLASMLDNLRDQFRCRPLDEVRVSIDFNAGIREIPRLGLFGWPRTVLEIGLPLALTLSTDEMRAVLAHEFAHISSRHGRGGSRLYRLQRTWDNVFEQIQKPASGRAGRVARWAVSKFIDWYWPRLQARTLILSRAQEYEADRLAAAIAGGPAMVSSLWRIECVQPRLSAKFWPNLHAQAVQLPEPPDDLFARLRAAIATTPAPEDATNWVSRALARATGNENTHPAFSDRARAVSAEPGPFIEPGSPEPARPSAAEAIFGARLEAIERDLCNQWRLEVAAGWSLRHRRAQADARKQRDASTAALGSVPESGPAPIQVLWTTARETFDRLGSEAAEPYLRDVLIRDPGHPGAGVLLGHHQLIRGEAEGERLLLRVAEIDDEEWMPRAISILHDHYRRQGHAERLREMRARLDRHEAELAAARRERASVGPRDRFLPHGLDDDQLGRLLEVIKSQPDCEAAWLARKDVKHSPTRPLFVLAVQTRGSRWGFGLGEREEALVRRLAHRIELPGQSLVVSRRGTFRRLAARVAARPGTEIHRRLRPSE
jgi:Zn-dependent protease with chaperone function